MNAKTKRLTAIDLFAGAGGLSTGLRAAGFRVLAAVELDPDAAASYRANHTGALVIQKDIRRVSARSVMDLLGIGPGELDLLAGCPPCQGFTRLTEQRKKKDPRNDLVREYLRFVRALRPRACMLENVPGLEVRGRTLFRELVRGIKSLGYAVDHDVLELADYGVPQFRKRLVVLAGRGFTLSIPDATHGPPQYANELGRRPWKTVRDAIGSMPPAPLRSEVMAGSARAPLPQHYARDVSRIVRRRLEHALQAGGRASLPAELRLACHERRPDGYFDVYGAMTWDAPAPTMTSGCTNSSKGRFGHPALPRPLTAREAALIQTFSRSYKFVGGVESIAAQVGNALPCRFAAAMGRAVRRALETTGRPSLGS